MQAITTKYIDPTSTHGARIKATCTDGSLSIPYPRELTGEDAFAKAAMALVRKLGWVKTCPKTGNHQNGYVGAWVCGQTHDGAWIFCFAFDSKTYPAWGLYGENFGA